MSELLKVNVNEHTEKKGGLTYLSWAWAWAEALKYDPGATWIVHSYAGDEGKVVPYMSIGDTAMVHTSVRIKDIARECMLPVMDNRNNAVKNPDARKVSDAIMRCMTKALAMHGLGLYIYAGEDLPEGDEPAKEEKPAAQKERTGVAQDVLKTNPAMTPVQVVHIGNLCANVMKDFEAYGAQTAYERIDEQALEHEEKVYLASLMPSQVRNAIKAYSIELHSKKA